MRYGLFTTLFSFLSCPQLQIEPSISSKFLGKVSFKSVSVTSQSQATVTKKDINKQSKN